MGNNQIFGGEVVVVVDFLAGHVHVALSAAAAPLTTRIHVKPVPVTASSTIVSKSSAEGVVRLLSMASAATIFECG